MPLHIKHISICRILKCHINPNDHFCIPSCSVCSSRNTRLVSSFQQQISQLSKYSLITSTFCLASTYPNKQNKKWASRVDHNHSIQIIITDKCTSYWDTELQGSNSLTLTRYTWSQITGDFRHVLDQTDHNTWTHDAQNCISFCN